MPMEPTPQQWEQIEGNLFAGRKIQAIKLYREATDAGLKEAKDAVEAREAQLRKESPDQFAPKGGCMGMIVLLMVTLAGLVGAMTRGAK